MKAPTKDFVVPDDAKEVPGLIYYNMAGKKRRAHATWYRGETTNFHPVRDSLSEPDAVERYVGHGWLPGAPFINREHYITAFGSCFASEVTKFLQAAGYRVFGDKASNLDAHVVRSGEGIVNSAALRQQFEWAFHDQGPKSSVWHDRDGAFAGATEDMKETTRQIFAETDVFIFTLGLSEVWYDKSTGDIFWKAIPKAVFDPDKHGFKVLTVEENKTNLRSVLQIIREYRPSATVVITLSPVPLAATFRPVSCITANCVSKASLRVAIDELMREFVDDRNLYYFPSYEIVTAFLEDAYGVDLRHPRPETIDFVMQTFKRSFLC